MAKKGKKIADAPKSELTPQMAEVVAGLRGALAVVNTEIPEECSIEKAEAICDAAVERTLWHAEAAEILDLVRAGNAVSPSRVAACLSRAVGLVPR